MQGYRRGNEAAFRELYARYRSPVLRFVRRLCPDSNDAEEIAQETWLAIVRGKERYETRARFTTYLFSIAHRRTMDRWCQRGRAPDVGQADDQIDTLAGSTSSEPDVRASNDELREDLLAAVAALPLAQREAFLLRAEGGLGLEEIAEITGTNRETAKSRLRFALVRLREALESWA
jgi:RNA polymerase sigma-70 factor (ECF subfamily)